MTLVRRSLIVAATFAAAAFLTASIAEAQGAAGAKPAPKPKRAKEFLIGGGVSGPSPAGSADAQLLNGAGSPSVTLFSTRSTVAIGYGLETNIGVAISRSLWVEVAGGFTRGTLNTDISDDFEGAADETISSTMSRFAVEGGVVKYFREKPSNAWFIRATGGWMRETAGGNTLTGDGWTGGAGLGFRQWWRTNGKGALKRVGLRLEGRAVVRTGGISLGGKDLRFGPAGTAHLVFGF